VQPVDPSVIKTARSRCGPENRFCRVSTLGQRRRLIAWDPFGAQLLFAKVMDGMPVGAPLLPGWSSVAIKHWASTFSQVLLTMTTS
jgi:hypothetical protein